MELKNCPFCNSEHISNVKSNICGGYGFYYDLYYCLCKNCGAQGSSVSSLEYCEEECLKLSAIRWNNRII